MLPALAFGQQHLDGYGLARGAISGPEDLSHPARTGALLKLESLSKHLPWFHRTSIGFGPKEVKERHAARAAPQRDAPRAFGLDPWHPGAASHADPARPPHLPHLDCR